MAHKLQWLALGTLWLYRLLTWSVLIAGLAFAALVISLRYWVLPNIERYRLDIARVVSERAGVPVTIERINASWDGLRPQLRLENVTVYDAAGQAAFRLSRIDQTLSWLSLPMLELRFHALDIHRPSFHVRRDTHGAISIAGVALDGGAGDTRFADWLLRQRDIQVHGAVLTWSDEQRGAAPLELKHVSLQVLSAGDRHRIGLRATPPAHLAAPVDVRGDLVGTTFNSLAGWSGRLYLQLDYADIAAWRAWIPFPVEFPRGSGALRAWLTFERDRLLDIVSDVRLADVRARLAPGLAELELSDVAGRIAWKHSKTGFEFSTSRLELATADGSALPPADFMVRYFTDTPRRAARGELTANTLELAPLAALADRLPLGDEVRRRLAQFAPKGALHDVAVRWRGDWHEPRTFSVRGRFHGVSLNRAGRIPGFSGVSGMVEGNERGGTLSLNSHKARIDMPRVFRDPLDFESFSAQVAWARALGQTELRLNSIAFSNAHLAGTVIGNYRTAASSRGTIDLTGKLTRADARYASRYVPLVVGEAARAWLDRAFIAGQSSDVSLRLKGDLDDFPFADGRNGLFQVAARVTGGVLRYADGWPDIHNIAGDLLFRGNRMDVNARQGTLMGVRLARVHAAIPDLAQDEETLSVSGEAEGATADFFAFMEKSPVIGMVDHFIEGWRAQGAGRLSLRLAIPLGEAGRARVAGAYQFSGNTLSIAPGLPALEEAGGRVEFTDSSVRAQNVSGVLLGGPVSIAATTTTRDAAVRVTLRGRVNADGARRAGAPEWVRHLRGSTDWRATVNARRRDADLVFESSLQGLALDFPAPLAKPASEAMPLRIERRLLSPKQDKLTLAIGEVVSASLLRRAGGDHATIERGVVRFGGPSSEPERNGVWVRGALPALDLDGWLALLGEHGAGQARVDWGGIDVSIGALDVMRRRFNELGVKLTAAPGGQWRGTLSGKGIEGGVSWQPQGRGRLVARMKTFAMPEASPAAAEPPPGRDRKARQRELPALDITAEQFVNKGRVLGQLELAAAPEGGDWRIEKLRIVNPEAIFSLDGSWQLAVQPARTRVNVRLEASDTGRLLTRLGYPEGVRRGASRLEGALAWQGAPHDIDYATLGGNLVLEAEKGQFLKLEPGIGKLLGILSLQALPRRIALDFRDVFSEGFSFDRIAGAVRIERGIARTDQFRVDGPSARVTMSGEVDLAKETQNLKVRVSPQVSDTVSIAGALVGGPIAGVAAYIAQKVLKDPLERIVSYQYAVTGTWSDPAVARLDSRPDFGADAPGGGG